MKMRDTIQVKWVPCHQGMARPQVADGGDRLQIWRVAANTLNKQSRPADKGLGVGPTTPHRKKLVCYEMVYMTSKEECI
jgi:hypothetical protein